MEHLQDVIKRPVVTEKSTKAMENNKYTFYVDVKANKAEIKKAIEKQFKVKVGDVRTIMVGGKKKRRGVHVGMTPKRKKAIIALKEGNIEFFEGV